MDDVEKFLLPGGIVLAALCILGTVAIVLRSRRSREQDKMSPEERERLAEERRKTWRRRLAVVSLSIAFVIIFCIAGIAAWLSFGAQKAYAFDRNGGSWSAATGFALLLDAGALGLSLLRLFEALTARSSQLTRFYLVAFIVASATMNLLHAPSASLGGRLVAVIPPLVYAVFLETLLKKVEQLVLGKYPKRKIKKNVERGYSLLLWVPFVGYPWQMWKKWRKELHSTLEYVRAPGSRTPLPAPAMAADTGVDGEEATPHSERQPAPQQTPSSVPAVQAAGEPRTASVHAVPPAQTVAEPSGASAGAIAKPAPVPAPAPAPALAPTPAPAASRPPVQPMGPSSSKPKKDQLRDALVTQILAGDLRVLDPNAQVANGAAYRANMTLGHAAGLGLDSDGKQEGLLKPGAVRTAVKQLLPELRRVATEAEAERAHRAAVAAAPEPVPQHHAAGAQVPDGDTPRQRQEDEEPVIGQQRSANASEEAKEAALT
ncbi:DUF2637 domain-containing protein [Streptomyces tendae]|uniref:DUF2637 domain-containing protein n=1 Tax=Streptomyces tendae TaxID=1932 RepID=UPI003787A72A